MATPRTAQDALFQQILGEFREMNSEIAGLRAEMETFKQTLEPIARIVRGDGIVQSLGTQIELVKQSVAHVHGDAQRAINDQNAKFKDYDDRIRKMEAEQETTHKRQDKKIKDVEDKVDDINKEDKKGKWGVTAAIITGSLGLIGTVVTILVAIFKK